MLLYGCKRIGWILLVICEEVCEIYFSLAQEIKEFGIIYELIFGLSCGDKKFLSFGWALLIDKLRNCHELFEAFCFLRRWVVGG